MTRRIKVAVLISGDGSNLQALMDAARESDYPAEIALVISNKAEAHGLTRAQHSAIPTLIISHTEYTSREAFDAALHAALLLHSIQLVCLAGFMRVLTDGFVSAWSRRLLNIHPSLLPKYKGLNTHARALEAGDKEHGATVHWVTPELDSGEIIAQEIIPILAEDDLESLTRRVYTLEHWLYPSALRKVALSVLALHA
jgi:phosphoribosylglycinamide formyltransferase 1